MKMSHIASLALLTILLAAIIAPLVARAVQSVQNKGLFTCINIAGTHTGACFTRVGEGAFPSRHLHVKAGTDPAKQVAVGNATDEPVGICNDIPGNSGRVAVQGMTGGESTCLAIASKAITAEARVYTDAGGKMTDTPVTGCWLAGRAKTSAEADGDEFELEPCFPVVQT